MLLALVLAAEIAAAPIDGQTAPLVQDRPTFTILRIPPNATPEERTAIQEQNRASVQTFNRRAAAVVSPGCPSALITARTEPTSLFEGPTAPTQPPIWTPGANPEEGIFPAVDTYVGGCRTPASIQIRNLVRPAQPATAPE